MRRAVRMATIYLFGAIPAMLVVTVGCEEREVFTVSQEDEIKRYVTDSEDGQELFGAPKFDSSWTFSLPDNDTTYTAILVSTSRSVGINIPGVRDFGIGEYYYGYATVIDRAGGIMRKQASGRTVETEFRWNIERVGFFVKLGDNNRAFSGWLLSGYYGGTRSDYVDIATLGGEELDNTGSGITLGDEPYVDPDYAFKDIQEIESIAKGSRIVVHGCLKCTVFANYESTSGFQTVNLTEGKTDSLCFSDTLGTSASTDRFWSYIYLTRACMSNDSTVTIDHSIIPYKLDQ